MATLLAATMMVPTIASAAYGYLSSGVSGLLSYASNAWADYQYHGVYVRLIKTGRETPYQYDYGHATSNSISGCLDRTCYAEAYNN